MYFTMAFFTFKIPFGFTVHASVQFHEHPQQKCGLPCTDFHETHKSSTAHSQTSRSPHLTLSWTKRIQPLHFGLSNRDLHVSYSSHSCYTSIRSTFYIWIIATQGTWPHLATCVGTFDTPCLPAQCNRRHIPFFPLAHYPAHIRGHKPAIHSIQSPRYGTAQSNSIMALRSGFMGLWGLSENGATTKGHYWKQNVIRYKTNEWKCRSVVHSRTPRGAPQDWFTLLPQSRTCWRSLYVPVRRKVV